MSQSKTTESFKLQSTEIQWKSEKVVVGSSELRNSLGNTSIGKDAPLWNCLLVHTFISGENVSHLWIEIRDTDGAGAQIAD